MDELELSRGTHRASVVFKALTDAGWNADRVSGSHHIFTRAGSTCLPVAVHGGKLRRDVLQHICRRAALSITEEDDDVIEAAGEVPPHALPEEHAAEPFVKAPAERRWVETSAAEQVEIAARDLRIEEHHCDEVAQYKRIVHEAQLHLVLGDYAAVESALVPMLGDEGRFEQLASLLGYEILGDALDPDRQH